MKKIALLLSMASLGVWLAPNLAANDAPQGAVLELHSCSVYAGGCIVSSQATQGGRYMLRVWEIRQGKFGGQDLRGLPVALLQISSVNMAESKPEHGEAALYLPAAASSAQRQALERWVRSQNRELSGFSISCRTLPLSWRQDKLTSVDFTAGKLISVKTASLEACPAGSCGQELWYKPQSPTSVFTVAVNCGSLVHEPRLQLTWADQNRASIFLGSFGGPICGKNAFVKTSELCLASQSAAR